MKAIQQLVQCCKLPHLSLLSQLQPIASKTKNKASQCLAASQTIQQQISSLCQIVNQCRGAQ
ncbi:hypothetical protein BGI33_03625 [Snodgrassella alvi]|nr:hypothetical protein BGI33_03625 [Snodgrassella alvi]PIT16985.1 hypothetical protein BGI34_08085 [Snodgrassella alvi]